MIRHGHARGGRVTPEYSSWASMLSRCYRASANDYEYYGGRGISVCERWRDSFPNFLEDMGPRPAGSSLDRIDPDGGYIPENCRWATAKEQARNRRSRRLVTAHGETKTISEWSESSGLVWATIDCRIKRGWTPEAAVSTPARGMARHPGAMGSKS